MKLFLQVSQPGYYYFYYNIRLKAVKDIVSTENLNIERKLIEIRDVLGRSVNVTSNKILLYIYDNGLLERKIILINISNYILLIFIIFLINRLSKKNFISHIK